MHIRNPNFPREVAVGGKKHYLDLGKGQHGLPKMAEDERGLESGLKP